MNRLVVASNRPSTLRSVLILLLLLASCALWLATRPELHRRLDAPSAATAR